MTNCLSGLLSRHVFPVPLEYDSLTKTDMETLHVCILGSYDHIEYATNLILSAPFFENCEEDPYKWYYESSRVSITVFVQTAVPSLLTSVSAAYLPHPHISSSIIPLSTHIPIHFLSPHIPRSFHRICFRQLKLSPTTDRTNIRTVSSSYSF